MNEDHNDDLILLIHRYKYVLCIIGLGFFVYFSALFNTYVWDDTNEIINNPLLTRIGSIPSLFSGGSAYIGTNQLQGIYYRPIKLVFIALVFSLFKENIFILHFLQIGLHILNALLMFYIFKKFFKEKIAFILSLIFLVHPINVESVAYLSGLTYPLFLFFCLTAIHIIITKKDNLKNKIVVATLFTLSLLTHEIALVYFIIIFILNYVFRFWKMTYFSFVIPIITITYAIFRLFVIRFPPGIATTPMSSLNLQQRLLNAPSILLYFPKTFFYPADLIVSQNWLVKTVDLTHFYIPLMIICLSIGLLIKVYLIVKSRSIQQSKIFIFFFLWFTISLLPYLQIFPLDFTVADRWFYFPFVGFLGMAGAFFSSFNRQNHTKAYGVLTLIISIFIAYLSMRTIIRNQDWYDNITLYSHDIPILQKERSLGIENLENDVGLAYFNQNNIPQAKLHFQAGLTHSKNLPDLWSNLGVAYERENNLEKAKSYELIAIQKGDKVNAYGNLVGILIKQNNIPQAQIYALKGLIVNPDNVTLEIYMAYIKYTLHDKAGALMYVNRARKKLPNDYINQFYYSLVNNIPISL